MCLDYFKTIKLCCKVQNPFYFIKMTCLWFRLWPGMFSLCWQSVWRQHQSCDSNHEAASDPARSLSGFASFSSQGIFGILVSDTLIVMGRPGFQWSAWISILLGSACWASATWCNRLASNADRALEELLCPLTHRVAYLWAEEESRDHFFFHERSR